MSEPLPQADVPVYNCIVYVSAASDGVNARVANLPDIQCKAASHRDALRICVETFKQRVAESLRDQQVIPWIDPPHPPHDDEQQQLIPVHL